MVWWSWAEYAHLTMVGIWSRVFFLITVSVSAVYSSLEKCQVLDFNIKLVIWAWEVEMRPYFLCIACVVCLYFFPHMLCLLCSIYLMLIILLVLSILDLLDFCNFRSWFVHPCILPVYLGVSSFIINESLLLIKKKKIYIYFTSPR